MDNWVKNDLDGDVVIDMSDSGYTNNRIGINFLKHFIEYTKTPPSPYILLLVP
jgi:hypothetical protein